MRADQTHRVTHLDSIILQLTVHHKAYDSLYCRAARDAWTQHGCGGVVCCLDMLLYGALSALRYREDKHHSDKSHMHTVFVLM